MPALSITVLAGTFAVCRLDPGSGVPSWALAGSDFLSITRAVDELSIVALESVVPGTVKAERGWRCFRLEGPFPFELTGILTSVADPLRNAGIGIFAISTFDTDYVLVKAGDLGRAITALENAGHTVRSAQ